MSVKWFYKTYWTWLKLVWASRKISLGMLWAAICIAPKILKRGLTSPKGWIA